MNNLHFVNDKIRHESFEKYSFLFLFDGRQKLSAKAVAELQQDYIRTIQVEQSFQIRNIFLCIIWIVPNAIDQLYHRHLLSQGGLWFSWVKGSKWENHAMQQMTGETHVITIKNQS